MEVEVEVEYSFTCLLIPKAKFKHCKHDKNDIKLVTIINDINARKIINGLERKKR